MKNEFTLRERKKAKLRLDLLESLLSLLKESNLSDIRVETICERAQTNKVTFFQNFKHKEQLLDFFICKWSYDRSHEIESGKYSGANGLKAVFNSISRDPLGMKIMIALVGYYARIGEVPETPTISACEYELFNSEAYASGTKPRNLEQLFVHYLSQIPGIPVKHRREILQLLVASLYGVPMQLRVSSRPDAELSDAYGLALKAALAMFR